MRKDREGMALLTVLLLVAVMSVLAVAVLDDVRFAVRRTLNAETTAQAQWYAIGAETLARKQIEAIHDVDSFRTPLDPEWNGRAFDFPIEEGSIRAVIRDGQACFNLNSVVEGAGEALAARSAGAQQFIALARAIGIPESRGRQLSDALTDWIDSDSQALPLGAEDSAYAALEAPYRTGGTLLSEVSELRAIRGFDPEVYRLLRPWVCALPTTDLSPLNVNTIAPERAALLTMMTGGQLSPSSARGVLAGRPSNGWADTAAFWGQPALQALSLPDAVRQQATVKTRYFTLDADVAYAGAEAVMSVLLQTDASGDVRTVARRWTIDE